MLKAPINEQLAVIYGTSERQIRRWQAQNAPLLDFDQMQYFFASQRVLPLKYAGLTDAERRTMRRKLSALDREHSKAIIAKL